MAPDRCGEGHVTIDTLSDDALLEIFSSLRQISHPYESYRAPSFWEMRWWIPLVHTCQRWRHIIFASPLRLRLVIPCGPPSVATKWESLDIWPPLPISVSCFSTKLGDYGSVVAALGHRDRVFGICFNFQGDFEVETVAAVMEKPFPALKFFSPAFVGRRRRRGRRSSIPSHSRGIFGRICAISTDAVLVLRQISSIT
jgi:hypothetical protein